MVYKRPFRPICRLKPIGGQEERSFFLFHVQKKMIPKEGEIYGLNVQCAMCMCVYVHSLFLQWT